MTKSEIKGLCPWLMRCFDFMFWNISKSTFQRRKNGSCNSRTMSAHPVSCLSPLYLFPVLPLSFDSQHYPLLPTFLPPLPWWLPSSDFPAFILEDSDSLPPGIWGISEHPALGLVFIFSSCCVFPQGSAEASCLSNWHNGLHVDNFCDQRNTHITS